MIVQVQTVTTKIATGVFRRSTEGLALRYDNYRSVLRSLTPDQVLLLVAMALVSILLSAGVGMWFAID
jgi:hypothetical protein